MPTIDCIIAWDGETVHEVFVDTRRAMDYSNTNNVTLYNGKISMGGLRYKPLGLGQARRRAKYGKSKKGRK